MKGAVKIIYLLLLIGYQQILAQKNENSKAKLLENTFPMYQKDSYKKVSLDEQYLTTQLYNNYARAAESDTLLISKQLDEVVVTAQFAPTSEKNVIYNIQVLNNQLIQKKLQIICVSSFSKSLILEYRRLRYLVLQLKWGVFQKKTLKF